MTFARVRLLVAALAFGGWVAYLGYAVSQRGAAPVLSRAQLAAATHLVVADLAPDPTSPDLFSGTATVKRVIRGDHVPAGKTLDLIGLPAARVPAPASDATPPTAGEYLLPLTRVGTDSYRLAGLPRSPGVEPATPERPAVYRWDAATEAQLRRLGLLQ